MSALDTLADAQSPKVAKTEKTEPAVSKRKSPNQRGYEDVRWHSVPAKGERTGARREAIAGISFPLFG